MVLREMKDEKCRRSFFISVLLGFLCLVHAHLHMFYEFRVGLPNSWRNILSCCMGSWYWYLVGDMVMKDKTLNWSGKTWLIIPLACGYLWRLSQVGSPMNSVTVNREQLTQIQHGK